MKRKLLLFTASCGFFYLALTSNTIGPAKSGNGERTGRGGASCAQGGCHTGGGGNTTATIEVRRKDWGSLSSPVTDFVAGKQYMVTLKGTNANLAKFGFQLLAVEGTQTSSVAAGTFSSLPAGTHQQTVAGMPVVEHSSALSKDGSGDYVVTVDWTAPASTSASTISFVGIINAVNGNGQVSGDDPSSTVAVSLQNTSNIATVNNKINLQVSPNPVTDNLNLSLSNVAVGVYDMAVYDMTGRKMHGEKITVNGTQTDVKVNAANWASGNYVVYISKEGMDKMVTIVKQ